MMYLGIDLGTSSVKLALINQQGECIADASAPLSTNSPHPLWSEQNPEEWWQALLLAADSLKKEHGKSLKTVQGIGLSGQQHGATFVDAHGTPLRPAILWNDGRSYKECSDLEELVPNAWDITKNRVYPGFTAPKVKWVQKHEADVFKKTAKILLPKDYLRFKLSGTYGTDVSDASGTSWLDVEKRSWSQEMLSACDLTEEHMPTVFEGTDKTGAVLQSVANLLGVPSRTPIFAGGGDNPASALSVNCVSHKDAFISLGTSGVFFVASETTRANPKGCVHTMCHAIPNMWHHMTVHLSAASCFDFVQKMTHASSLSDLFAAVEANFSPENSVYFLPFLSGERTPYNNPQSRGVFFGLEHKTRNVSLLQAAIEGVAFNFANGQEEMEKVGIEIGDVSVVGGGSRNLFVGKILASALNRPLFYRKNRALGGAIGAARLALLGHTFTQPEDVFTHSSIETVVSPDPYLAELYEKKRALFTSLYYELEPSFSKAYALRKEYE